MKETLREKLAPEDDPSEDMDSPMMKRFKTMMHDKIEQIECRPIYVEEARQHCHVEKYRIWDTEYAFVVWWKGVKVLEVSLDFDGKVIEGCLTS